MTEFQSDLAVDLTPLHTGIDDNILYESICQDIASKGFSVKPYALPVQLAEQLLQYANSLSDVNFSPAGVGRADQFAVNQFVRKDKIRWFDGQTEPEQAWFNWGEGLKTYLNRHLFLGLFSFESHLACYEKGHFYKRHLDAFSGQSNRVLSIVVYLNHDWQVDDGGELVLYENEQDLSGLKVLPSFATVVAFLSEQFPHEVLPASRDRLSIAGWFSLNRSVNGAIDPPR